MNVSIRRGEAEDEAAERTRESEIKKGDPSSNSTEG